MPCGGVEVVDVGAAVRVDPRQLRHDGREVGEVVPGQLDTGGRGDGDQVHRVVGRAARGQQRDDAVDERLLVEDPRDRRVLLAARKRDDAAPGFLGQRAPQRGPGLDEAGAGQVQAHHLDDHLVGVGGAVERAGPGRVVRRRFGVEQVFAGREALGVQLPDPRLLLVRQAGVHRPGGHEDHAAGARTTERRSAGRARSCRRRPAAGSRRTCRATARSPSTSR